MLMEPGKKGKNNMDAQYLLLIAWISAAELAHLRLTAVKGALKLTHMEQFENQLSVERFEQMCLVLQDSCYQVRERYAHELMTGLRYSEVHYRYLSSLFLMAHEIESGLFKEVGYRWNAIPVIIDEYMQLGEILSWEMGYQAQVRYDTRDLVKDHHLTIIDL